MLGLRRAGERGASGERASGGEGLLSPAATSELVLPQKRAQRNILDTAEQQIRAHGAIIDLRNQCGTSIKYLQRHVFCVFLLQTCYKHSHLFNNHSTSSNTFQTNKHQEHLGVSITRCDFCTSFSKGCNYYLNLWILCLP